MVFFLLALERGNPRGVRINPPDEEATAQSSTIYQTAPQTSYLTGNMASLHLHLTSCALLLALTWRASTGLPVTAPSADSGARCAPLFRSLLLNITGVLDSGVLCHRLTTSHDVAVRSADTVQACAPTQTQKPGCVTQRNTPFSESECLSSIMKDLAYYEEAIKSYLSSALHRPEVEIPLLRPTQGIIQNLRKDCSLTVNGENNSLEVDVSNMWKSDSYKNRQEMCKMMRGFHIRTITISRAMGYISSGDHRK